MDRYQQKLSAHKNVSTGYAFLTSTDYSAGNGTTKVTNPGANFTIFVQKITLSVTTDNAATQLFQDSAGTPVPIAMSKVSPGLGAPTVWDFGPEGVPLTEGKDLLHKMSAAGMAGYVGIQAYAKRTKAATTENSASPVQPNV